MPMIEVLASIEPASLPVLAVLLFAASLYPVGLMLGSPCSPCCGCSLCTEGSLPDTCTVTLSGFPDSVEGPNRLSVLFDECFGNGAAATVTEAGGAISTISLTSGGSGYAILGRTAPTLSFSGQGSGAAFTPVYNVVPNACGVDFWQLASVSATGGSGYVDGEYLVITAAGGDTTEQAAVARLYVGRAEPTLAISGNATATVSLLYNNNGTWRVDAVTVTNGGSGYTEGAAITFDDGVNGVEVTAALATARVVHDEPDNVIVTISTAGGSGAQLEPVWELLPEQDWPAPHKKLYRLASMTITNAGSGYADYDPIYLSFASADDGVVEFAAFIDADVVGGGGEILSVYVADQSDIGTPAAAGEYIGSRTDALHSVAVNSLNRGEYYETSAGELLVTVESPGSYYHVDATEPPYVSSVTLSIFESPSLFPDGSQWQPSTGSGATFDATVDDDPTSPTFGEITALSVTNGGSGYQQYPELPVCCGTFYNDKTFVLSRKEGIQVSGENRSGPTGYNGPCVYEHRFCGVWNVSENRGSLLVYYYGPNIKPQVRLLSEVSCNATLTSTEYITDCDEFAFTATSDQGGVVRTAIVTPGGEYDATNGYEFPPCWTCCRGEDEIPNEISVLFTKNPNLPADAKYLNTDILIESGTFVLALVEPITPGSRSWRGGAPVSLSYDWIGVGIGLCANHVFPWTHFTPLEVLNADGSYSECEVACVPKCAVSVGSDLLTCDDCVETPLCRPPQGASGSVFHPYEFITYNTIPPLRLTVPGFVTLPPGTPEDSIGTIEVL